MWSSSSQRDIDNQQIDWEKVFNALEKSKIETY